MNLIEFEKYTVDFEKVKFVRIDSETQIILFFEKEFFVALKDEDAKQFLIYLRKHSKPIKNLANPRAGSY